METPTTRPARVVAIGVTAAVIGGTMVAMALIKVGVTLFLLAGHSSTPAVGSREVSAIALAALQLIFGVPGLVAGLGLIRYRPWARGMLEFLGWIGGLFCVGGGIFTLSVDIIARGPDLVRAVGVEVGLKHFLYAAVLGIMIYHLHKPDVKAALSPAARRDERPAPDAATGIGEHHT